MARALKSRAEADSRLGRRYFSSDCQEFAAASRALEKSLKMKLKDVFGQIKFQTTLGWAVGYVAGVVFHARLKSKFDNRFWLSLDAVLVVRVAAGVIFAVQRRAPGQDVISEIKGHNTYFGSVNRYCVPRLLTITQTLKTTRARELLPQP